MMSFTSFLLLPREIQEMILDHNPEMAPILSRIPDLSKRSNLLYVNEFGAVDPLPSEIDRYLNLYPSTFAIYSISNCKMPLYTFGSLDYYLRHCDSIYLHDPLLPATRPGEGIYRPHYYSDSEADGAESCEVQTASLRLRVTEDLHERQFAELSDCYASMPSILKRSQLDLVTCFRILSQRVGCCRRRPTYAKDWVLNRLEMIYSTVNQNVLTMVAVYSYLLIQAKVLNLFPIPRSRTISEAGFQIDGTPGEVLGESDFVQMRKETPDLYTRVHLALTKL